MIFYLDVFEYCHDFFQNCLNKLTLHPKRTKNEFNNPLIPATVIDIRYHTKAEFVVVDKQHAIKDNRTLNFYDR